MVVRTTPARDVGYDVTQCLRKRITFADAAVAKTVGVLPPGAVIVGGGVRVITAFNAGTTNPIHVGVAADDDDLAVGSPGQTPGFHALGALASSNDSYSDTAELTIIATYVPTGTAATAGVADVNIMFVAPASNP